MEEPPMKHKPHRRPGKPRVSPSILEHINLHAAGIDCGSAEHFVAVPPDRDASPVQSFQTFTGDLGRLADWLINYGVGRTELVRQEPSTARYLAVVITAKPRTTGNSERLAG
jgi:hypothetical protein